MHVHPNNEEYLDTKVTNIGGRYHIRLIDTRDDKIWSEMACREKEDITFCIRYILRMHDKCGGMSRMADASRHRPAQKPPGTVSYIPKGRIWYPSDLPVEE